MKTRSSPAHLPLLLLLLAPVFLTTLTAQVEAPTRAPSVVIEGRELPVPVTVTPSGPLFALTPLAQALGGKLARGEAESFTLTVGDTAVVLALGSSIATVGEDIVSLSQPVTAGEGGPQVPLDLLRRTFGDLAGYSFEWAPEQARLAVGRREARQLAVLVDVVHLQGTTTVVLQFPEAPRYRIDPQPGRIVVEMLADRLAATPRPPVEDPLVQGVDVSPERVEVVLVAGAAVESYVLENPFRLVFDVHQPGGTLSGPAGPDLRPPEPAGGIRTIVIDPGHGGTETGAIGPSGVLEKDLTLLLAQALASRLGARLPVRVVLTRGADANLPLESRTAIANQNKADLFLSIHLNSSLGGGASGAETYFLSAQATDSRAARSAESENRTPPPAAPEQGTEPAESQAAAAAMEDVQLMLWDLAQSHHLAESQRFATLVQEELNQALGLKNRGVKQAPFRVLMGAAMPAVLVELGFVSNPDEETKLQDATYRASLVEALAEAVARYKAAVENRDLPAPAGGAPAPVPGAAPAPAPAAPPTTPAKPPARRAPEARPR